MSFAGNILIADAGGTSTRWCLLGPDGQVLQDLSGAPVNVCVLDDSELHDAIHAVLPLSESASAVYFYGAGCAGETECNRLTSQFQSFGFKGDLHIHSDMVGAARSLFGDKSGIACILGTGSNSCLYDGREIIKNIPPLGFILGDEGGGAYMGKKFLKALIRGELPDHITKRFNDSFGLTVSDIYERVYRRPQPNKFLASIASFVHEQMCEESVSNIVSECFDDFFEVLLKGYDTDSYQVGFTGSVAYYFEKSLRESASRHGITISTIEQNPMAGLLRYHSPVKA